ncbi:MAG: pyridoxal phosphate-dependent aminotransferase [Proteobacteria bacterium]|nr:pyridoxal phosphate-dependent aminotransferase [Pseudomonadota bacterium]
MTLQKNPTVSVRGAKTPPSPIRKLAPFANAAKARGVKVYHLNIGQPDIKSPQLFFEGLRGFADPVVAYEPAIGNERLCKAWSAYMNRSLGLATTPSQFLITAGASEALLYAFAACCDPGDEILVFDPTYANYIGLAYTAGVAVRALASRIETGFALPPIKEIQAALTARTKAIVVCNPNNPTGVVYSREELKSLIELCDTAGIFLIADEAYREFTYDGREFLSVYHLAPNHPNLIIVDSLSKRFSLCGARVGCLISSHPEIFAACHRLAMARLSVSTADQLASAHLLEHIDSNFTASVTQEYQRRRDALLAALQQIPGVVAHKPSGAFYAMVGLPVENAEKFATFMLQEFSLNGATTFVAPGAGFYLTPNLGLEQIRLAYVLVESDITAAVQCLSEGLAAYKRL